MSEENNISLFKKQKQTRPKIEDVAADYLSGEALQRLLDFAAYLRENKIPHSWDSGNTWKFTYKGKKLCVIRISDASLPHCNYTSSWHIGIDGDFSKDYEEIFSDDKSKETAWDNIKYCRGTGCPPPPGTRMAFLGKEFENVCQHTRFIIDNPNAETIECAKKLIQKRCDDIINGKVISAKYVPKK